MRNDMNVFLSVSVFLHKVMKMFMIQTTEQKSEFASEFRMKIKTRKSCECKRIVYLLVM